jgi:cellulose synthase/poly-beta-1,6-N-acetylglucosamine synthase-like glycosyltransferase
MNSLIDIVNLIFAFIGIYFMVLYLLLFSMHKRNLLKRPKMKKYPFVSIIIPAYNEEDNIKKTVENVKKLKYPGKKEIIVVDDGSTDRTYEIVKKIKGVKVLRKKNGGKASALNYGLRYCKGKIVVCIDSDSYPEKNALIKTIPFFVDESVAAVTTSVVVKNAKSLIQKLQQIEYIMIAWSRKLLEFLNAIYVTPGPMSLYRKDVLLKVGGFDEKNLTEDIEIAWRLMKHKYKIKMALDTIVYTNVPSTLKKWWRQRLRWNIGGLQTTAKYFYLFLNKEFSNIGMFVLPVFSISYILSLIGLVVIFYIIFNWARYILASITWGFSLIGPITLLPDLFWVLAVFSFLILFIYLETNLRTMKKFVRTKRRLSDFFIYLTVYISIFPFNLLHSFIKFVTKNYEW